MNKPDRKIVTMGQSALDWCLVNPWDAEQYARTVTQLEAHITEAMNLGTQSKNGSFASQASTVSKAELGLAIRNEYLVPLNRIARAAAPDHPDLPKRFRMPKRKVNRLDFIAIARAMHQDAVAERELFLSYGLPEGFFAELAAAIDAYEQVEEEKHAARALHVGANADISGVARDILKAVRKLDAMNRNRFAHDRERLAAWMSARNVAWPSPAPPDTPGPDTGTRAAA